MTADAALDSLKPYPAYKDSGVEWIGEIPQNWSISRADRLLLEVRRTITPDALAGKTVTHYSIPAIEATGEPVVEDGSDIDSNKLLLRGGEILVSKLNPRKSRVISVKRCEGLVVGSSEMVALEPQRINPRFAEYVYAAPHVTQHLASLVVSATRSHQRVSPKEISRLLLAEPTIAEQQQIAAFLDDETSRIDELVREQEQLLEDLSVKRQATINALTLAVPGQTTLPANWRAMPLKAAVRTLEQGWSPQCENRPADHDLGEWGVLKVGCVNGDAFNAQENKVLPPELTPIPRYALKEDDVLISRANTRDLVGSAARVEQDYPHLLLCDKLYRLRVVDTVLTPDYLVCLLGSPIARAAIEKSASGASASMVNISQGVIRNLVFPIPPVEEQHEILKTLRLTLAQIDQLSKEVRTNIEDMKLLRSTLITAAVTGKIDVRHWSPA